MQALLQDLLFGARMLRKNPSFTLIAVLTLALGIGANTAIFSVVNAVLLRALPYPQLERLFVADDDKQGAAHIVLLSHAFWQEKCGGDPAIVGKTISLDRSRYTVVGVLPAGFEFFRKDDIFIPLSVALSSADLQRG